MLKQIVLILLVLLASCSWDKKVAQVGEYPIYESAVKCRDAVIAINFPDDKRKLGLDQLLQSYRLVQILKNYGQPITEATIQSEKERIDKTTLTPQALAQIKAACDGDKSRGYIDGFVIPTYAERTIYHDFFLHNPKIHQEPLSFASRFKSEIESRPNLFATEALKEKIPISVFKVSLAKGVEPHRVNKLQGFYPKEILNPPVLPGETSQEGTKWINQIITPLKPGQVFPELVDQGDVFLVVRYLRSIAPRDKLYEVQAAVFPKLAFNQWLEPEKQKVKLTVFKKD